jgi:hypothetical protein
LGAYATNNGFFPGGLWFKLKLKSGLTVDAGQWYHAPCRWLLLNASLIGKHRAEHALLNAKASLQDVQAEPISIERFGFAV